MKSAPARCHSSPYCWEGLGCFCLTNPSKPISGPGNDGRVGITTQQALQFLWTHAVGVPITPAVASEELGTVPAAALGLGEQSDIVGMSWLESVALDLSQRPWPRQGEGLLFLLLIPMEEAVGARCCAELMAGSAKLTGKQDSDLSLGHRGCHERLSPLWGCSALQQAAPDGQSSARLESEISNLST